VAAKEALCNWLCTGWKTIRNVLTLNLFHYMLLIIAKAI